MFLENKTILITGANRGIGLAISKVLANHGARLILTARQTESLEIEVKDLPKYSGDHLIMSLDVNDEQNILDVFKKLNEDKVAIHGLINNAGVMVDATLQMYKSEEMHKLYQTNVFGSILVAKSCIKFFVRNRGGSIVNMSSIIGTNGNHGQSIYGSSKAAIIGFTKSLSKELAPLNIRVNAIAPGFIDTEMTKSMDSKFYDKNVGLIGMKRIGKPEDVANLALFLVSDLSNYVTGQIIGVDGGMII